MQFANQRFAGQGPYGSSTKSLVDLIKPGRPTSYPEVFTSISQRKSKSVAVCHTWNLAQGEEEPLVKADYFRPLGQERRIFRGRSRFHEK